MISNQVKGVRPRPLTCAKRMVLKRFAIKLTMFDLGHLLVVRIGILNDFKLSLGCLTQAAYFW